MSRIQPNDVVALRAHQTTGYSGYVVKHGHIAYVSFNPRMPAFQALALRIDAANAGDRVRIATEPGARTWAIDPSSGLLVWTLQTARDAAHVTFESSQEGPLREGAVYRMRVHDRVVGRRNEPSFSALTCADDATPLLFTIERISERISAPVVTSPPPPVLQLSVPRVRAHMFVDDGPTSFTESWVSILERRRWHACAMINGAAALQHPEGLDAMIRSPYIEIGVHTFSHRDMAVELTLAQAEQEIRNVLWILKEAYARCGIAYTPPRRFRFPNCNSGSGETHAALQQMLARFGFDLSDAQRRAQWGSKRRDVLGHFFNDHAFQESFFHATQRKSVRDYRAHMRAEFDAMSRVYARQWAAHGALWGCHDGNMCHETFKFLAENGMQFTAPP